MLEQLNISTAHFAVILYIVFGLTLILRSKKQKTLICLAIVMLGNAVNYVKQILTFYDIFDETNYAFTIESLLWSIPFTMLYTLFVIELRNPDWLNVKRVFYLIIPLFVVKPIYIIAEISGVSWRLFNSPDEIFIYINEFNVWIRLFFFLISMGYLIASFVILYKDIKGKVIIKWAMFYAVAFVLNLILYILMIFYGTLNFILLHKICYMVFNTALTYLVMYYVLKIRPMESLVEGQSDTEGAKNEVSLSQSLLAMMEKEKPWLDTELTQPKLAGMLCTNRTTLSEVIHGLGYVNFQEFINYYRIREFKRIVSEENITNIEETFYRVGFRSKSTAFRSFSQFEKTTPSNYLRQLYT